MERSEGELSATSYDDARGPNILEEVISERTNSTTKDLRGFFADGRIDVEDLRGFFAEGLRGFDVVGLLPSIGEFFIFVVIFFNTLQLGICAGCDDIEGQTDACYFTISCGTSESIFVLIFLLEAICKIYSRGRSYWFDPWDVFDFSLAVLGVLGDWILPLVQATNGKGMRSASVLRAMRVVKLIRILRVVKLMRMFKSLEMIIEGLLTALKGMIWIGALLTLLVYCSAVFGVVVFKDLEGFGGPYNFDSLGHAMWAMYSVAIAAEWTNIVQPAVEYYGLWGAFFWVSYCFIATLGVLNLIIGVITERTAVVAMRYEKHGQEQEHAQRLRNLKKLSGEMYKDTIHLSHSELTEFFHEKLPTLGEDVNSLVTGVGLPAGWHLDDCSLIFDRNCSGKVSKTEFENGMCALVSSSEGLGILMLQQSIASIAWNMRRLEKSIAEVKQRLPEQRQFLHSDVEAAAMKPHAEAPLTQPGALLKASGATATSQDCHFGEQLMRSYTAAMAAAEAAVDELRSAEHLTAHLTGHIAATSVEASERPTGHVAATSVEASERPQHLAKQSPILRQVSPSVADVQASDIGAGLSSSPNKTRAPDGDVLPPEI